MKPGRTLRIPAVLTWTTLVACAATGPGSTQQDASSSEPPAECAQPDDGGGFTFVLPDGGACPVGDKPIYA